MFGNIDVPAFNEYNDNIVENVDRLLFINADPCIGIIDKPLFMETA